MKSSDLFNLALCQFRIMMIGSDMAEAGSVAIVFPVLFKGSPVKVLYTVIITYVVLVEAGITGSTGAGKRKEDGMVNEKPGSGSGLEHAVSMLVSIGVKETGLLVQVITGTTTSVGTDTSRGGGFVASVARDRFPCFFHVRRIEDLESFVKYTPP